MEIKTVKINHPDKPGDYRIINEVDFDPARQELFEDVPPEQANIPHSQMLDETQRPIAVSATKSDGGWVDGNDPAKNMKRRR